MSVTAAAAIDDACVLTQGDVDRHTHRGRERRPARRGTAEVAAAPAARRTSVGSGPCDAFCPVASGPGHARWLFGATRQGAWFRQRRKPMALLTSMRGGRAGRRGGPPGKGAASARLRAACRASTGRTPAVSPPVPPSDVCPETSPAVAAVTRTVTQLDTLRTALAFLSERLTAGHGTHVPLVALGHCPLLGRKLPPDLLPGVGNCVWRLQELQERLLNEQGDE